MKRMSMMIVVIFLLGGFGSALAQSAMPVFCGDLSEADCEIVRQYQDAMLELNSFAFTMSMDFTISNIPDMADDVTFLLTGSGEAVGDTASLARSPEELLPLMSDPQAYAAFMGEALESIGLDASFVLKMPAALVEETGGDVPASIPLNIVLADGIGYLDFTTLRNAVGEAGESFPEGWYGIDLGGLMTQVMAMADSMGGMDQMTEMDPDMLARFSDPEFMGEFMTIERLGDETAADGSTVAVFRSVLDYQAFMSNPEMRELMMASIEAQGLSLSEDELAEFDLMMSQMFNGLSLNFITTIGLDDYYSRSMQLTMDFDMSSIMAMAGEMGGAQDPAPVMAFNMTINPTYLAQRTRSCTSSLGPGPSPTLRNCRDVNGRNG